MKVLISENEIVMVPSSFNIFPVQSLFQFFHAKVFGEVAINNLFQMANLDQQEVEEYTFLSFGKNTVNLASFTDEVDSVLDMCLFAFGEIDAF